MSSDSDIRFHIPFTSQQVDEDKKVIRGVSLMTGDLEAEGHDLHVDDTTLSQILQWANKNGKVTVKADHKGADGKTFKAIVGYLTNFRLDAGEKKVRGDLELLHTEPLTPKILEMAKKMPENFGLSAAFKGKGEKGKGGKNFARCSKLLAVDLVENPAANPDGLFSAKVDSGKNGMADNNPNLNSEPTLADIFKLVQQQGETLNAIGGRIKAVEDFQQQVNDHLNAEPGLDELAVLTDEQLEQAGFDVAKVRAAVDDAIAAGEMEAPEGYTPASGADTDAAAAAAATVSATGAPAGAALSKKISEVVQLEIGKVRRQARAEAEQAEAEHAFAVIEAKVEELSLQNEAQATKITQLEAENKALKLSVKTGSFTRVAPGTEAGVNFAGGKAKEGTFEHVVQTEFARLVTAGKSEVDAKALAYEFGVKKHEALYLEFRERGGKTIELAAQ